MMEKLPSKKIFLCLLLEALLTYGAPVKDKLEAPHVDLITTFDPAGIRIHWELLESPKDDPIIGYRMEVWELSKKVISFEEDEHGESKLIEKIVPIQDTSSFDYKTREPKWIVNVGPKVTEAEVTGVNFNVYHELRVQAITENEEGPFSSPSLVSLGGPDKES